MNGMNGWQWIASVALAAMTACAATQPDTTHIAAESALGPYSAAVLTADLCFVSGKIGERGGTIEHEIETAIDAVERQLGEVGLGMSHVVQVTVYLTDMDDYPTLNRIYAGRFSRPYPARAVVEVRRLPGEARVEIQTIARR